MTTTLADLFQEARARTIEWNGRLVNSLVELPDVAAGGTFTIEFLDGQSEAVQGLRLSPTSGAVEIEGEEIEEAVLWRDTAPPTVVARAVPGRRSAALCLWNCWRGRRGGTEEWTGSAGMLVEDLPGGGVLLRCSDGYGEATFDALVVRVTRHQS